MTTWQRSSPFGIVVEGRVGSIGVCVIVVCAEWAAAIVGHVHGRLPLSLEGVHKHEAMAGVTNTTG